MAGCIRDLYVIKYGTDYTRIDMYESRGQKRFPPEFSFRPEDNGEKFRSKVCERTPYEKPNENTTSCDVITLHTSGHYDEDQHDGGGRFFSQSGKSTQRHIILYFPHLTTNPTAPPNIRPSAITRRLVACIYNKNLILL